MADPMFTAPVDPEIYLKSKQMDLDSGSLGRFFGSGNNAQLNIAGMVVLLILTPLIVYTFVNINSSTNTSTIEFWKICLPVITMILGYVFGRKS